LQKERVMKFIWFMIVALAFSSLLGNSVDEIAFDYVREIYPEAASLEAEDIDYYRVHCEEDNFLGYLLHSSPFCDEIIGFVGPTPLLIGFDEDYIITGIALLPNDETPRWIRRVINSDFLESWDSLQLLAAKTEEVKLVSGATVSARAIKETIQKRIELFIEANEDR